MANVFADYADIAKKAKVMREHAQNLNSELSKAYKVAIDLNQVWYGEEYNDLTRDFNRLAESVIKEALYMTVTQIPYTLETIANNYSKADRKGQKITAAEETPAKQMQEVPQTNQEGMYFVSKEVEAKREEIKKHFEAAIRELELIESESNKMGWESDEAEKTYRSALKKVKTDMQNGFQDIINKIDKKLKTVAENVQAAEDANNMKNS